MSLPGEAAAGERTSMGCKSSRSFVVLNQQHGLSLGFVKQKPVCGTGTPGPPNGGKRACRNPAGLWIPAEPSGRQSTHPAAPQKAGATGEQGRHAAAGAPWQPPPPPRHPPARCPSYAVRGQKAPSPWELPGEATAPCACWKPSALSPRAQGLPLLSPLPPAEGILLSCCFRPCFSTDNNKR